MAVTPKNRPDPGCLLARRRLWVIGLSLFVIADIALVAMALSRPSPPVPDALRTPTFTLSPAPSSTPTVEPPQPLKTVRILNPTRILEARDDALVWRATTGPCLGDSNALTERTVDSGATWKQTNATGSTDVVSLQTVTIEGKDVASMIGQLASDCSTSLIRIYVAGDNYERYPADLGGAWFVHPLDHAIVHSPAGDFAAIGGERAAALYNGQAVQLLKLPPLPGALPLPELAEGGTGQLPISGCFPTAADPESLAGNIAVSEGAGTLWLWAGDALVRSSDGSTTWE